jgi:hypothetical protein
MRRLLPMLVFLGGLVFPIPASNAVSRSDADAWRADLRFLSGEMLRVHPNLFHAVGRREFEAAVAKLDSRIPSLSREDVIVEMAKIVALIGEGHTQVRLGDERVGFGLYPLNLYQFSDGLFVRAAPPDLQAAVGGRILRIGRMSAAQAMAAVRPIVQHDNEMTIMDVLPDRLAIPEILHSVGACAERKTCVYEVESVAGRRLRLPLRALPFGAQPAWVRANAASPMPLPLYLLHRDKNFWFEDLSRDHLIYVQYNVALDGADETVEHFVDRVFSFIETHAVDRMILDLRLNNGGDNTLNAPLIRHLRECTKINRRGHLFVVIGRLTFSAGMNCAMDLEKKSNAIFVGEPTGSSPNQYGDPAHIVLPHSGITVMVSTRYWEDAGPTDHRSSLAPQITATLTSKDYRENRDPAMEAILRLGARKDR